MSIHANNMERVSNVGKKIAKGIAGKVKSKQELKDENDVPFGQWSRGISYPGTYQQNVDDPSPLLKVYSENALPGNVQDTASTLWVDELIKCSKKFTEVLEKIRAVFLSVEVPGVEPPCVEAAVAAHDELSDVIKTVLQQHPTINGTDILAASCNLITQIKGFSIDDKDVAQSREDILFFADQLALTFTESITEYVRDQQDNSSCQLKKVQSCESLPANMDSRQSSASVGDVSSYNGDDADNVLRKATHGVDVALNRAKLWTKYAKDIIIYMDKRNNLLCEYAKKLSQLALISKPTLMEESYLPFQSIFCMAMDEDIDFSSSCQAAAADLVQLKIINRLTDRRAEHDRIRRLLRDEWAKEQKKLEDALLNLKKTKTVYLQRQTEYEKVKESNQKTDVEVSQQSAALSSKADKKKKLEDDAMFKAIESENSYRMAIVEAKTRKEELDKTKGDIIIKVRKLLEESDRILQKVVTEFFHVLHSLSVAQPVQLKTLAESCQRYEPAAQYFAYIRSLSQSLTAVNSIPNSLSFEPFSTDRILSADNLSRTPVSGSDDINDMESPVFSIHKSLNGKDRLTVSRRDGHVGSAEDDLESGSLASWQSISSTPSGSPQQLRRPLRTLDNGDLDKDGIEAGIDATDMDTPLQRGVSGSQFAQTHSFQRVITPATCKICNSLFLRGGVYCSKCNTYVHKKCLDDIKFECGNKNSDDRLSGVANISFVVLRCIEEIDKRGLELKGIYRTSGAKLKVEELTRSFEQRRISEEIDLGEHHPNVIASVLKQCLRELPEPLLTFQLYPTVIKLMKKVEKGKDSGDKITEEETIENIKQLLRSTLPEMNWLLCKALLHHLKRVSDKMDINQMTASNLGIVFGPTLLRTSEGTPTAESLLDTQYQARLIEMMIRHCDTVFSESGNPSLTSDRLLDARLMENVWDVPEITVNLLDELALEEPHFQKLSDDNIFTSFSSESNTTQLPRNNLPSTESHTSIPDEGLRSPNLVSEVMKSVNKLWASQKLPLMSLYSAPATLQSVWTETPYKAAINNVEQSGPEGGEHIVAEQLDTTADELVVAKQWTLIENTSLSLKNEQPVCSNQELFHRLELGDGNDKVATTQPANNGPSLVHQSVKFDDWSVVSKDNAFDSSVTINQYSSHGLRDSIVVSTQWSNNECSSDQVITDQHKTTAATDKLILSDPCKSIYRYVTSHKLTNESSNPGSLGTLTINNSQLLQCHTEVKDDISIVTEEIKNNVVKEQGSDEIVTNSLTEDFEHTPIRKLSRGFIKRSYNEDPLKYRAEDITPRFRHLELVKHKEMLENSEMQSDKIVTTDHISASRRDSK